MRSAAFSPDGRHIVTASWDKTAIVWDAAGGQALRTLAGHASLVQTAAFSPDGRHVVTASEDKTAIVWDVAGGKVLRTLARHGDGVNSAEFSPDGRYIVTASKDSTAIVWDAAGGHALRTLAGHTGQVLSAAFSPDGCQILTASWDSTAIVWDAGDDRKVRTLAGHTRPVQSAAFSPDGRQVLTASWDSTAIVWDADNGQKVRALAGHTDLLRSVAFSPDGRRVVTASSDKTAIVWDAATGEKSRTLGGHIGGVNSAAFSPDGRHVVTASVDETAIVWDAATGQKVRALAGHRGAVRSAAFSPDGRHVVTGLLDETAVVWDAADGQKVRTLAGHKGLVYSAAFSPDGRYIVTASSDGRAIVWDGASGRKVRTLVGHTKSVLSAAFSPDGRHVVTASVDETAIVWDAASGEKVVTLAGHTDTVRSAAFSPDGRHVITASFDGTTRAYDVATGRELCSLLSFDGGQEWLAVTPEGYYQGSLAAEQFVRWRVEGENGEWPRLVGPEQFREVFYRPDLFRHLLAEGDVCKALARADDERGKATRPTKLAQEMAPLVIIASPRNHAKVMQPDVRVEAMAKSVGIRPIETLQLELNGRPEGRIQRVQDPKPGRIDAEWPAVQLRPGENTFRVIARAGGSAGPSDPVTVTYLSRDQIEVRLRILVIGVDKYKLAPEAGGYRELQHAAEGARQVAEAFVRYGGQLYSKIMPPNVLLDDQATRDNILESLDRFSREMGKEDVGVIFYAGHGDKSNDRLYLTTHDTDKNSLVRTSVSAGQLRDILAGMKGRVYLFLDACHSGAITQRSGSGDSLHEDLIRELRKEATGTVIATACRGDEKANEDERGGFFTLALIEGLSGKARSPSGAVYPKGLKVYVEDRVKELTRPLDARHQQRPYFDGSEELMNLPLAKP